MSNELPWIDWSSAQAAALMITPPGPRITDAHRLRAVKQLRDSAAKAPEIIADCARLPERGSGVPELVVDRAGFVKANIQTASHLMSELGVPDEAPNASQRLAGIPRGRGVGAAVGYLATRVLGQYDAFGPSPRLLLVAPSIVAAEQKLKVAPKDFRMWVALHEQTHRVQFANAPWLSGWIIDQMSELVAAEQSSHFLADLDERLETWQKDAHDNRELSTRVMHATSPASVGTLERVSAVMSLLEGHADVMMDRGGPQVIPTLETIRSRFDKRRNRTGLSAMVGRLIGMDTKLAQYRDGAAFCRGVISSRETEQAGIDLLNTVFTSPDALPSMEEILHPENWLARI